MNLGCESSCPGRGQSPSRYYEKPLCYSSRASQRGDVGAIDLSSARIALYKIKLEHSDISYSEVQTLRTFFEANKLDEVTAQTLADGNTYTGLMLHEPDVERSGGR